ncbi:hypothetical protein [Thalassotalea maritima]|uniref:hypothetical protein n=1 Tax=Thalassotalea maritima TaxID=3242416 RepID=UPI003528ED4F
MYQYSVALAVFDYVPIILSATGLYFIVRVINQGDFAYPKLVVTAALLIISAGLCKATWKLIIALNDVHISVLNNALFVLMTPGFVLLAFCMWVYRRQYRDDPVKPTAWRCPASIILLFASISLYLAMSFPEQRLWFLVLLLPLTIANCVFTFHAAKHSFDVGNLAAGLFFILNIIGVFAMSGLARTGDQSEAMQWIEEIVNAATQGAWAIAGYLLFKSATETSSTPAMNTN